MTLADRLIVMNAGIADQSGPPLDLYERPETVFVAGFIGSPAMNLVPGTLAEGGVAVAGAMLPVARDNGRDAGYPVLAGLRPEHVEPAADGPLVLRLDLLERLGADTILHGTAPADGTRLIARVPGSFAPPLGSAVTLAIRPECIHLFDRDTGKRL
ncbi:MAG: TOBE domain-containing protein, partial [Stellaceae bacterium]